jgi:hypothetical protein
MTSSTTCPGHPIGEIPLAELRKTAQRALHRASDATVADFRVTDDDGTDHTAGRDDLLLLVSEATSKQGLAELLLTLQDAERKGSA